MEYESTSLRSLSDTAIVSRIAEYIRQIRLDQNLTQAELAYNSGVSRLTISQFELGKKSISLLTLIQILRGLNRLDVLEAFIYSRPISPLVLAQMEQQYRKRASKPRQNPDENKPKSDW